MRIEQSEVCNKVLVVTFCVFLTRCGTLTNFWFFGGFKKNFHEKNPSGRNMKYFDFSSCATTGAAFVDRSLLIPKWPKSIPYFWPKRLKIHISFGAAHTYIAHKGLSWREGRGRLESKKKPKQSNADFWLLKRERTWISVSKHDPRLQGITPFKLLQKKKCEKRNFFNQPYWKPAWLSSFLVIKNPQAWGLRWLNTVFDTCVHSPFSLKPLNPRSPKMAASKLTTQTLVFWWLGWHMCRCHGNMTKYKQAL